MDFGLELNTLLDTVASTRDGDLMGLMQVENLLGNLSIPPKAQEFRRIRKTLLPMFAVQMRESNHVAFLAIISHFTESLQSFLTSPTADPQYMEKLESELQEFEFDRVHKRRDGLYPPDYFDNMVEDPAMLTKFLEEAREHLQIAQLLLLDIENDPENQEHLNTLFRAFHTIKGSAAFLGIHNLQELAHEFEGLLSLVRDGSLRIAGTELIDILFHAIKYMENLLEVIPACNYESGAIKENYWGWDIGPMLRLARHIIQHQGTRRIGEILLELGSTAPEIVQVILDKQKEKGGLFGEVAAESGLVEPSAIQKAVLVQKSRKEQTTMVKVSAARLNTMVDLAGELVIIQSMIKEGLRVGDLAAVEKTREQLEVISTGLKELALGMGMVPMTELFNRLRIVVRNTAHELGKVVDFSVRGADTELDRKLVDVLYDPLTHMIRNAIDHGIEDPAARKQTEKLETGNIVISAVHKNSGIEIIVEDDGRGIDPEKLVLKALGKGMISEDHAKICKQNLAEAYKLLFLPGFSTKDEVTGISGRGVGMDVVKTNIDSVGGRLEIWSKPGKGTRFIMRVPLSLAIIDGFVCLVGQRKFVFPFSALEEVLIWPTGDRQADVLASKKHTIVPYRADYLSVMDARTIFTFGEEPESLRQRPLLVLRHDEMFFGLVVDTAIGQQEIVIKSLDEMLERIPCISGGSIFGDGSIGFVVSMDALAAMTNQQRSVP